MHIYCKTLAIVLLFSSCSVRQPSQSYTKSRVEELKHLLFSLSLSVDKREAQNLAESAIDYSYQLVKDYELKSPPLWQNTLVNLGIRKRGLCYHWADDLWHYLHRKNYKTLEIYYITANRGKLTEHNALSVGVVGLSLQNTIVLDAWRDSGDLYFIELGLDKEYAWKERKLKRVTTPKGW